MAVVDELTGSEDRRNELGAVDECVETRLEQADQVFRGVTTTTFGFFEDRAELLLADIAVVALQLLLGTELNTEVRKLGLAALAVLARAVLAAVDRGLRTAPDVFAHTAVDFVLGCSALAHRIYS